MIEDTLRIPMFISNSLVSTDRQPDFKRNDVVDNIMCYPDLTTTNDPFSMDPVRLKTIAYTELAEPPPPAASP